MFDNLGVGAGPSPLGSPGSGSLVMFPAESFETALLDLTVPNLGVEIVPAKPGYISVPNTAVWLIEQAQGNQTVPLSVQLGSDPAHVNWLASVSTFPTAAQFNACVGITPCEPGGVGFAGGAALALPHPPNTPIFMDVTAGAQGTGPMIFKARLVIWVFWVAGG